MAGHDHPYKRLFSQKDIRRWQDEYIREGEARGEARGQARGEARGQARGEARGRAQGQALSIVQLARDGDLPRAKADLRLRQLHDQGLITSDDLAGYLTQLG